MLAPNERATSVKVGAIVVIYTAPLPQITHDPELWAFLLGPFRCSKLIFTFDFQLINETY